jgi:hypothetical protein
MSKAESIETLDIYNGVPAEPEPAIDEPELSFVSPHYSESGIRTGGFLLQV